MASIDVLQQLEDRNAARTRRFLAVKLLLAEYRRAVAAEAFYEQLQMYQRRDILAEGPALGDRARRVRPALSRPEIASDAQG